MNWDKDIISLMNQTKALQKLTLEQRLAQIFKLSDFVRELAEKGNSRRKRLSYKVRSYTADELRKFVDLDAKESNELKKARIF